ncbi:MAG: putative rane protein [Verrucomicrobia bacterium]|nr:putative rane protein [Verrucomicrobiota bacterium]
MEPAFWAKAHGATTHFPVALALCSAACDAAGFVLARKPIGNDLRTAGYWTMLLGAIGTAPAVMSGLLMTKGTLLGHDSLRLHHVYVWPAFALLVALGTWRVIQGRSATRRALAGYLILACVAAGLISAAAYWGGEMMIAR